MCSQFTLHHKFRIESGRTIFKQWKTDCILYSRESHEWGSQGSQELDLTKPRLASYKAKVEKAPGYGALGRYMACSKERIEVLSNKSNAIILYDTLPAYCISKVVVMESGKILFEKVHVSPRPPPTISFKDSWTKELVGFRSRWRQQRHPTNPTKTKNPIIKNGETRRWARVHEGNRERYLVWSRGREALNKNGETRMWIRIHTKLRVDAYKNWRRSNKNGETRKGGGARHWLQSTRTVTCSCERSRKHPCSRTREEDRKSSSSRSTSCRFAAE